MSAVIKSAIDRVPAEARNREQLAALLEVTEAALAEVARDEPWAEHHRRIHEVAAVLWLMDTLDVLQPKSPAVFKARAELSRAVNAARMHAKRHGLRPNDWGGICRAARLVLDAVD